MPRMPKRAAKRREAAPGVRDGADASGAAARYARHDVIAVCRHSMMRSAPCAPARGVDAQRERMRAPIMICLLMPLFAGLIFSPPILPFHAAIFASHSSLPLSPIATLMPLFFRRAATPDSFDAAAVFR
jgi:hypothetical protein